MFPGKRLDLPNVPIETPSAAVRVVRVCGRATLVPTMADAVSAAGVFASAPVTGARSYTSPQTRGCCRSCSSRPPAQVYFRPCQQRPPRPWPTAMAKRS